MTETDIVKVVKTELKKRFSTIVYDYHKLEDDSDRFKGYGNSSGISVLSDIDNRYYVTINILRSGVVKYSFREDDNSIINAYYSFDEFESSFFYFLLLIEEYSDVIKKWGKKASKFTNKEIPHDFIRNLKIEKIMDVK
jgi:hypothetical protein